MGYLTGVYEKNIHIRNYHAGIKKYNWVYLSLLWIFFIVPTKFWVGNVAAKVK